MNYATMSVRPIGGTIGAEIDGIDLRQLDNEPMWEELKRALLEFHVLAIRGQELTPDDQMDLGRVLGEPSFYPFAKGMESHPHMTRIVKAPGERKNFGADWHTDSHYLPEPPKITTLYAIETPPRGGDTLYAGTCEAYDALSDGMKRLLEGLYGVNSASLKYKKGGDRAAHHKRIGHMTVQNADKARDLEAKHPVVRTIPENGRKALYLSALHTIRFDGMTEEESRPLIEMLDGHIVQPEFVCRVRWEPGQLTMWDNRCTLHNAVNDYQGHRREMRRLTLGPEKPVS